MTLEAALREPLSAPHNCKENMSDTEGSCDVRQSKNGSTPASGYTQQNHPVTQLYNNNITDNRQCLM